MTKKNNNYFKVCILFRCRINNVGIVFKQIRFNVHFICINIDLKHSLTLFSDAAVINVFLKNVT